MACQLVLLVFLMIYLVRGEYLCEVCDCRNPEIVHCEGFDLVEIPTLIIGNYPSSVIFLRNPRLSCVDIKAFGRKTGISTVSDCDRIVKTTATASTLEEEEEEVRIVNNSNLNIDLNTVLELCILGISVIMCTILIITTCCLCLIRKELHHRDPPRMRFRDGRVTESDSDDDRPSPTHHRR